MPAANFAAVILHATTVRHIQESNTYTSPQIVSYIFITNYLSQSAPTLH